MTAAFASYASPSVEISAQGETVTFDWGQPHHLGTAAYWIDQAFAAPSREPALRLGKDLYEEIAACLLGGFGMPAEVALTAYEAVRQEGLLDPPCHDPEPIRMVLERPLAVPGRARPVRYRFPRQRSDRLAAALHAATARSGWPDDDREFRDALAELPGVGIKTASWVTRNMRLSDDVAVIDVHIHNAGVAAGFFSEAWKLPRDYRRFEAAFCEVARLGGVGAAELDAVMWEQMALLGNARSLLLG